MKRLVVFIVLVMSAVVNAGYVYSNYAWSSYGDKEYALTLDRGDWDKAEAEAEAVGGTLVNINDEPEDTWLYNKYLPELVRDEFLWIGFYQDHDDPDYSEPAGGWKWICGDPVTYVGWDPPEPTNHPPGEDYGTLTIGAHWNDWGPNRPDFPEKGIYGIIEIPEPATILLLGLGGLVLRKKHRAKQL